MGFLQLVLFVSLVAASKANPQPKIPPRLLTYDVDPNSLTVSGISSGGAFATQYHFIYSSIVKGAGIFAGGPYLCGYGGPVDAAACMLTPSLVSVPWLISEANILAAANQIDPVRNLADSKVYIFHGFLDSVVDPLGGRKIETMYQHYGANIGHEFDIGAGHGQPVDGNGFGGPCGQLNILHGFVNECAYNGAYEMFKHLYGDNITRPEPGFVADGELLEFNQGEFFAIDPIVASMSYTGLIYVPKACKNWGKKCRLHVAFHGCMANEHMVGDGFATKTQYNDVAEVNDIIVMYPQTTSTLISPVGCWDWFGYTGLGSFATKWGNQPAAVNKMTKRVMGIN
ncbi:uncharacterized protein LOC110862464 [Folsomia candida]|uniref:Poly(3-hydroxyalkanoate) depolymerase C n=1 Tax=Folsomia candida TaxID=158441 RepID=A0A226F439_FOLCA|nr:uncharacterized protein LOC110862464 [Folsomia candida]OXA64238.1 Poly(3-hydroxyalkanoate) depolymerase C [Folsomia candida]